MPNTFTLIASSTVGAGGAASIDFTSIPSTYTDLKLILSARSNASGWTASTLRLTFNSTGGTSYSRRSLYNKSDGTGGSNSTTSVAYIDGINGNGASSTSNTFASIEIYIPNYLGSNNKSLSADSVTENNGTDTASTLTAGLFSSSSAISSISVLDVNGNFVQYTTAYLYGISKS